MRALTVTLALGVAGLLAQSVAAQCPVISVTSAPSALPNGTAGASYGPVQFSATSAPADTYTFDASGLPNGMAMSAYGDLSGRPEAAGTYAVRVVVTGARACVATHTVPLYVSTCSHEVHGPVIPWTYWMCESFITVLFGNGTLFAQSFGGGNELYAFVDGGAAYLQVCFAGHGVITANHFDLPTFTYNDGARDYSCVVTWVDGNTTFFELFI